MKCLKNFRVLKGGFEEFKRIAILDNPEVYADQNVCIVEIDDIPEDPYIFVSNNGNQIPIVTTLDYLKNYVQEYPMFYFKKRDEGDDAIVVKPEEATHILRLPRDTNVNDLIIMGQHVLKIDKKEEGVTDGE